MISQNMIEQVKQRLISTYKPLEIYIFGSYAWGRPDKDSDLDILVVIKDYTKDRHSLLVDGHRILFDLDFSKDLLIYSKSEFDEFSSDDQRFCHKVKNHGRKIYTAEA